jgi:hypothetical protein
VLIKQQKLLSEINSAPIGTRIISLEFLNKIGACSRLDTNLSATSLRTA